MGGSIPKEKYIKICSSYFPLFRRTMLHFTREKYFDGVKCRPSKVSNYIRLQNIILTIAIIKGCRKSFHYMGL